jgi:hypothetical protein
MNRQRLILFVLVVLFAVAALWSYSAMPRFKTVGSLPPKPGQPAKPTAAPADKPLPNADDGTRLKIGLLDAEPVSFKGYRRNIFKPVFVDEVKIVRPPAVAIKPPPKAPVPVAAPVITRPEPAPLARFTFLGFLKKGSVRTIFLAKGTEILLVKKGDVIVGRYEATEISDQALTLTVTDTGGEIIIPLMENRPLATVR